MIDISQSKIPKMKTLRRIVDLMAGLKLNQLQLYIEGVWERSVYSLIWLRGQYEVLQAVLAASGTGPKPPSSRN
ncbi:hypothetical protein [Paenibacillus apii]|uniref:hypothetical protein n=1 Tax=Paenibacillus apii TaxID=1850370 RepID=UPI001438E828|nr:hypothetical protein [Paenibacillus apii]NJJ41861.1 hypothetical protein [Paenibacillus apii]